MGDNGIKVKTMEYAVSHKHSFKWLVKDDILHCDASDISRYNQLQSVIASSELKNTSLRNFCCRCQLQNKDSWYSVKQNIFNFPDIL